MRDTKTKRELFTELLAIETVGSNNELVAFIEHELELLDRKSKTASGKSTKKQVENEAIKAEIVSVITSDPVTVNEFIAQNVEVLGKYTNQKITAMLTALAKDGLVNRVVVKGKALYSA